MTVLERGGIIALIPAQINFFGYLQLSKSCICNIKFGLRRIKCGIFWKMRAKLMYGSWTLTLQDEVYISVQFILPQKS